MLNFVPAWILMFSYTPGQPDAMTGRPVYVFNRREECEQQRDVMSMRKEYTFCIPSSLAWISTSAD
jgi:hypothetical protein